jgi:predicted ATP-grasp superfamily ATP-dependent carboligase
MIIGGHYLSLGAARNLASNGIPVCIVDSEVCVAQFSRRVRKTFHGPPVDDETAFVAFLSELARQAGLLGWVVFASTDQSVRVLAQSHAQLSRLYRLTTPSWDVVQHFYDKRLTHRLAVAHGVPTPETANPGSEAALAALNLAYPVVLKPAITTHLSTVTKKKAYRADNGTELLERYRLMAAIMDPTEILVQELIPGRGENLYSYGGLFQDGRPVAGVAARRPRQHPMEFGRASTLVETVDSPELAALASRLLAGTGYSGLAEVEFMFDPRHNRFELLEVNPRIWGWQSIARRAGVDLPFLTYAQALGQAATPGLPEAGVKWVRLITDTPTALGEMREGRLSVSHYVRSLRGKKEFAVLSASDPLPFIMELLLIPYYAKRRGF